MFKSTICLSLLDFPAIHPSIDQSIYLCTDPSIVLSIHASGLPIHYFICGGPSQYPHWSPQISTTPALSYCVSHVSVTMELYLTTLLVAFFHKRYIVTYLVPFLDKSWLSFGWKMSPVLLRKCKVWLFLHSIPSLCLFYAASDREAAHSVGRTSADSSIR